MNMSLTLPDFTPTTQALLFAVLVGGAVLILAGLSMNNPLLWKMGIRNILRHRAQTLMMLCGLLLSSIFLTVSFGLQDSFSHSVAADRLTKVGDVDEAVTGTFTQDQLNSALTHIRQQAAVRAATAIYLQPLGANFSSQRTGITRNNQYIMAVPPDFDQVYGALRDSQGRAVSLAGLRPNEVLLSHSAAKSLDIKPGDQLKITLNGSNEMLEATVRAVLANDPVVTDGELAFDGSYPELILPLATFQQFSLQALHQSLLPNTICIRNVGPGAMSDRQDSQAVLSFLEGFFHTSLDTRSSIPTPFDSTVIHPLKPTQIEDASWSPIAGKGDFTTTSAARQFDLLLPVLTGLLASASLLLLVLLCLLLAADRRVELGIARAVGLQRHHLVETLLIECCGYSLLAAVPGVLLGMGVLGLDLLTLSNVPALNFTSSADIPLHLWISWQNVLSVLCLGLLAMLAATCLSAIWISHTNIVTAIRNLDDLPARAKLKELVRELTSAPALARRGGASLRLLWELFARGPPCLLIGYLFLRQGQNLGIDWLQHLGVAALIAGAGLLLTWLSSALKLPAAFSRWLGGTLIGLAWLVYGLQAGAGMILLVFTSTTISQLQASFQDLLLSLLFSLLLPLIGMVVLVMSNSDGLASALHLIIRRMRGLAPVSRPSMAYPLTFRFRTGVAVSLLSLALFLVMLVITNNLGLGQQTTGAAGRSDAQLTAAQNAYTTSITRFLVAYLLIGVLFSVLSIGVIASRAVIERRQQIGMLRALGFSRVLVRRSFLLEASFIVTLSLVIGTTLAWWLVSQVAYATSRAFFVPVLPALCLLLGCYLVSFICTFIPAQRASGILPAEALRYE
jgi:ABC-type lipoprotein release transport system permease subunit